MKQRIFAALIAGVLVLQLAGCGNDTDKPSSQPDESAAESRLPEVEEPVPVPAIPAEPESEPEESPESEEESAEEAEPAPEPELTPLTVIGAEPLPLAEIAVQAPPQVPAQQEWNPFALDPKGLYTLYAYRPAFMIYANLGVAAFTESRLEDGKEQEPLIKAVAALNDLNGAKPIEINENSVIEGGFILIATGEVYERHQYLLRDGSVEVDGTAYKVSAKKYEALKEIWSEGAGQGVGSAQWLAYMNPTRVVKIECTDTDGALRQMRAENIAVAALEPRYVSVYSGLTYTARAIDFNGMFVTKFTFDGEGGIVYTIAASGGKLYVESSDMDFGCEYNAEPAQITSFIQTMQGMISGPANPRTM